MATYHLISTTNATVDGWEIFGTGSKKEMEQLAINHPQFLDNTDTHTDIHAQTLYKNSRVVSKTEAKIKYNIKDDPRY